MIYDMAMSQGFAALQSQAQKEIEKNMKLLARPSDPKNQTLDQITALQGELRGLSWWIERVEKIIEKAKEM